MTNNGFFLQTCKLALYFLFFWEGEGGRGRQEKKPGDIQKSARHKQNAFVGFPLRLMAHDVACTSLQDSPVS